MKNGFSHFASMVNDCVSSPAATFGSFVLVLIWALSGPIAHYSDAWQLVINTTSSIITFIMVFVLNNAQNRGTAAINAKLDNLILAIERADNRFVGLERLPATEAEAITRDLQAIQHAVMHVRATIEGPPA